MGTEWPAFEYEELPWKRDPEALALIPKSRRRKIDSTYAAAIPPLIAERSVVLEPQLLARLDQIVRELVRFDAEQARREFDLPSVLLRSESSASSKIENLTSSARNIALAQVSKKAPKNAQAISRNLAAMREALALPDALDEETIVKIHAVLMGYSEDALRDEQVWIGGTPYSPHGATYVPPRHSRVPTLIDDLARFAEREDIHPIAKAAIAHAQFESIHPFTDGNGRCGRTLLHKMLRADGVLEEAVLPVSSGLLHETDAYMAALDSYHLGDITSITERLADALEVALVLGRAAARDIQETLDNWDARITERKGSAIRRLPALLVAQPVVTSAYVSEHLDITTRAATTLLARACELSILRRIGSAQRNVTYQSDNIIAVLDEISSTNSIRCVLAKKD